MHTVLILESHQIFNSIKESAKKQLNAYTNEEKMSNNPTHITERLLVYTFHFRDQGQVLKQAEETCSRNTPSTAHCYKANIPL